LIEKGSLSHICGNGNRTLFSLTKREINDMQIVHVLQINLNVTMAITF